MVSRSGHARFVVSGDRTISDLCSAKRSALSHSCSWRPNAYVLVGQASTVDFFGFSLGLAIVGTRMHCRLPSTPWPVDRSFVHEGEGTFLAVLGVHNASLHLVGDLVDGGIVQSEGTHH